MGYLDFEKTIQDALSSAVPGGNQKLQPYVGGQASDLPEPETRRRPPGPISTLQADPSQNQSSPAVVVTPPAARAQLASNVGNAVSGYGGLDEGAGFALARQAALGSAPQGLPPGVSQLRMDVPADGPKHLLGPGWNENASQMPSVVNPAANSDRAWGNASGQGPITATIGNGITREDELRIRHQGGPLAVLAANQAADLMPLQRNALAAHTDKTQAETNKILQDPGFEGRRVGAIEQEAQNRLTLGQGEIAAKTADTAMRERLGMGQLGAEQQKINLLGQQAEVDIAGKKLNIAQQQQILDLGQQLSGAKTPEETALFSRKMAAMLGKEHPAEWKAQHFGGGTYPDPSNPMMQIKAPDTVLMWNERTGEQHTFQGAGAPTAPKYTDGELRQDPNTKAIFKYDAKANKWVPK